MTVKGRRYYRDQREFLDAYMRKLLELGFCEEMAAASCTFSVPIAPLLVQKKESWAKFRLAID